MPPGTVYVGRPTKWGNNLYDEFPFSRYEVTIKKLIKNYSFDIRELRGKDLACWCPLDQPCHADVLLEIANKALDSDRAKESAIITLIIPPVTER